MSRTKPLLPSSTKDLGKDERNEAFSRKGGAETIVFIATWFYLGCFTFFFLSLLASMASEGRVRGEAMFIDSFAVNSVTFGLGSLAAATSTETLLLPLILQQLSLFIATLLVGTAMDMDDNHT